jgi:large subunit ribosomal protein L21
VYALVETGGKQYKVSVGQVIDVEKLVAQEGDKIELGRVLMVSQDDQVRVGAPVVEGAKVMAQVMGNHLGDKVIIFRYMAKERFRHKRGHRQEYTRVKIEEIVL